MAIFLRESDVENLATMKMSLEAVEQAFKLQGEQKAENVPRRRCRLENGCLHVMSASLPTLGIAGLKAYSTLGGSANFLVHLYDTREGSLLAVIEANRLGQLRTGAATGVATKHMARPDAASVGIFGTGWQARGQLLAVSAVRPIKTIVAFGRDPERLDTFTKEMSKILGIGVVSAANPEEAVRDMDIIIAATTSIVGSACSGNTCERSIIANNRNNRGGASEVSPRASPKSGVALRDRHDWGLDRLWLLS